jgi:hypothetical protein
VAVPDAAADAESTVVPDDEPLNVNPELANPPDSVVVPVTVRF